MQFAVAVVVTWCYRPCQASVSLGLSTDTLSAAALGVSALIVVAA